MVRFLCFCVEQVLAGHGAELKEYAIGVEVFDRRADYDPRVDPIVRVEARRLREKLKRYYATESPDAAVRIELPTGSYVPQFCGTALAKATAMAAPVMSHSEKTVAVLPFANLSLQAENEYFADGLTAELIHVLTKVPSLRVVAWGSAAHWKNRKRDMSEIVGQLQADVVLDGSVRWGEDRVRVTVQLIETKSGTYLWSEAYDRELENILAIQDEIAQSVAAVLEGKLGVRQMPAPRTIGNLDAYQLYLKGRHFWNKRTSEGLAASVGYFEQAIAIDPNCAHAYAGIADAWSLMVEIGLNRSAGIMPLAKSAAERALALDPTLAEAWTSLALIRSLYDREWAEAEGHYRTAIRMNPGFAQTHYWFGTDFLLLHRRFDEAMEEVRIAQKLDPLNINMFETESYLLLMEERYEEALAIMLDVMERETDFWRLHTSIGRVYGFLGRWDEAIAALERGRQMVPDMPSIYGAIGQIYAWAGREEAARRELAALHEFAARRSVSPTCFALIHCGLHEYDKSLEYLETACERRDLPVNSTFSHPAYKALRGHPRFQGLLRRLGFAIPGDYR
ncbi:MAG: hypothetical protein JNK87_10630 [Bryobacterales bacterium]|nr:hypothetical protein [Bryobacterales bacterium]